MSLSMYRHERLLRTYRATFTDKDGNVVTDVDLQAGIIPAGSSPRGTTTWTAVTYTAYPEPDNDGYHGETTVLFAGPDADPTGAIVLPARGGYFYLNVVDTPEVDAERVERITVQ